ncbi:hypothetical protein OF113_12130 [Ectopseudomonas chengduensis]|jgi:hypothetical protein|nr:hypothetical protein [Pseudomonas chengduensis]UZT80749.1 hypothetical protein OF113_12130 [Pseudomonas chengduensis]
MNWSDLCGINTTQGKGINMATLVGPGVNHDRRGKTGMPNGTVLTKMMNAAEGLRLKPATRTRRGGIADGISFHIALYVPGGSPLSITDVFVDHKTGAAVCYENTLFTDAMVAQISGAVSDIVIRQSVAPCTRCRAGYSQLARNAGRTIFISSDDGYDGAPRRHSLPVFPHRTGVLPKLSGYGKAGPRFEYGLMVQVTERSAE